METEWLIFMSINRKRRDLIMSAATTTALTTLSTLSDLAQAQQKRPARRMPVIFVGHGSPMNAIEENAFTKQLKAWGKALPKPVAILSVSAHWLTPGTIAVDIQDRPPTIHDFGGFPQALFDMQYPAPGAPAFAREAAAIIKSRTVQPANDWGIDHGTWSVLHHMYPKADIPVFQLSIDYDRPGEYHYAIGRELTALRDKGVLIMGSGNIVHNLRALDRAADSLQASRPWAHAFDTAVKKALEDRDDKRLINYLNLDSATMAVPTPDHYLPFLYALGAADELEEAQTVFEGFQAGTLSMRCVQFGT